jgi:integrase
MDRDEAERREQELRLKLVNGSARRIRGLDAPPLEQALHKFIEERYEGDSRATARSQGLSLIAILGPDIRLNQIDEAHLDALVRALKANGNTNATINRKLSLLQALLKEACYRWKVIHAIPRFQRLKEPRGRIRVIEPHEEQTLDTLLRERGEEDMADLVMFLIDTGCRLGEALRLRWRDINWAQEAGFVWKTKTDAPRVVVLTKRVLSMLRTRQGRGLESPFAGLSKNHISYVWARARREMGLVDDTEFTVHALRHTCATRLVNAGVPLYTVQRLLGHSTIKVTERYAHLAPAALREAQTVLNGLNQASVQAHQNHPSLLDSPAGPNDGSIPYGERPASADTDHSKP